MKTYMEEKKGESFDWNKFLKNAIRRKTPFDQDVLDDVIARSQNWVTCACGNQCSVIPRYQDDDEWEDEGSPIDNELRELGVQFFEFVQDTRWIEAKETLKAIEARSTILINEIADNAIKTLEQLGYIVTKRK